MVIFRVFIVGSKNRSLSDIIRYKTIDKKVRDNTMSTNLKKKDILYFFTFIVRFGFFIANDIYSLSILFLFNFKNGNINDTSFA